MSSLTEVFGELFRSFGYTVSNAVEGEGTTGRRYAIPLLLQKDARRVAATTWERREPLDAAFVDAFIELVKDTGCDGGLLVSLGPVPERLALHAQPHRVQVWDSRHTAQELGNAVISETAPTVWDRHDPLSIPRPSRILEQIQHAAPWAPPPAIPVAQATLEAPFPSVAAPVLASPNAAPADTLQLPLAFGIFDAPIEAAPSTLASVPAPAVVAPPALEPIAAASPTSGGRMLRKVLRIHVNKNLAVSLAKPKTKTMDRLFLRLVPYHLFDYEATVLVEGSLQGERKTGRMAVDAAQKKAAVWTHPLDVAELPADAGDIDEKPLRINAEDASKLVAKELRSLVTRDVVMAEDASEWSVVVKKKVTLGDEELRLQYQGTYWQPIWRISGREGSVEVDATTGHVLFEESLVPASDSQLI